MKPKAVLDTSFLVEHFRKGNAHEVFGHLNKSYHVVFSCVVLMELFSGAYDRKEHRLLEQIRKNFMVVPVTERQWCIAGEVMSKLRRDKKVDPLRIKSLLADILIAVSSRDIGAVVVTRNDKDFSLIKEVFGFKLITV